LNSLSLRNIFIVTEELLISYNRTLAELKYIIEKWLKIRLGLKV